MAGTTSKPRAARGGVALELSPTQVAEVVLAAHGSGGLALALAGVPGVDRARVLSDAHLHGRALSRSLIAGFLVLAAFPQDGGFQSNGSVARMLDLSPSTCHRYVSTLVALGLLQRDPTTRLYRRALPER
jgi:hypothetical protein